MGETVIIEINPLRIAELVNFFGERLIKPRGLAHLIQVQCHNCKGFMVNAEDIYRFFAEAENYYYKHQKPIEIEILEIEANFEDIVWRIRGLAKPNALSEEYLAASGLPDGVHTGYQDWDFDQNEGWPLRLIADKV
jgi:hypothetical protein